MLSYRIFILLKYAYLVLCLKRHEYKTDTYFELQGLGFVHLYCKLQKPLETNMKVCLWQSYLGLREETSIDHTGFSILGL